MNIDEAVTLTQERLAEEGSVMGSLLEGFRNRISPVLIGAPEWERILDCAGKLPITLAAAPFGFELPLHSPGPEADFGVTLVSGTRAAAFFEERARADNTDATAGAITRLCGQIETRDSPLCEIVSRKLMLEYDIGPAREGQGSFPGMFLWPGARRIIGASGQEDDLVMVGGALASCMDWEVSDAKRNTLRRAYLAMPEDTQVGSFGIFPSRSRAIRLSVMGLKSQQQVRRYLEDTGWPGDITAVNSVIARFKQRVDIARIGLNIDVQEDGIGPTLGFTPIVKHKFITEADYWLDNLIDWAPFLEALEQEDIIFSDKIKAVADWVSKPTPLFARSGRYILLQGIHHVKLVISENQLQQAKAYAFMALSAAARQ